MLDRTAMPDQPSYGTRTWRPGGPPTSGIVRHASHRSLGFTTHQRIQPHQHPILRPPYPLLMSSPVHPLPGITVEHTRRVLQSVRRGIQLVLRFRHFASVSLQRLTCPRQHPIRGSRHQARYPAGYPTASGRKTPVVRSSVSRCLSTTGIRFLGTLSRREFRPDHSRPTTTAHAYLRTRRGPRRGFTTFHTRETRTGPDAVYTPGMTVFAGHRVVRGRRLPPHNGRSLPPRQPRPSPGCLNNEASARVP
jgi:hypothetical protein